MKSNGSCVLWLIATLPESQHLSTKYCRVFTTGTSSRGGLTLAAPWSSSHCGSRAGLANVRSRAPVRAPPLSMISIIMMPVKGRPYHRHAAGRGGA